MNRNACVIRVIITILFGFAGHAGAAKPAAEITRPVRPVRVDLMERLNFTIIGTDSDNDLNRCEVFVDGVSKGSVYFILPQNNAGAAWIYAFNTPGPHTVAAIPFDEAGNEGEGDIIDIEVTNQKGSLDLSVLTYNTHLFKGVGNIVEQFLPQYQDETRSDLIKYKVGSSGADIVALQEVWAYNWQVWFASELKTIYPYSAYNYSACNSTYMGLDTLSNGLLLLSKWPLSDIDFQPFTTFTPYDITQGKDYWAKKGVLTATVDIGGSPMSIGISHTLTGEDDYISNWSPYYVPEAITTFQLNGEPYIFALRTSDGGADIRKIEDYSYIDKATGTKKYGTGWKHLYTGPLHSDYRAIVSFELNGHPHLFGLKSSTDQAYIFRINNNPSTGWQTFGPYSWDKDCIAAAITSFQLNGHAYIFALRSDSDQAELRRINTDPVTGELNPSEPFENFGPLEYNNNWLAIKAFESNGNPWLYGLKPLVLIGDQVFFWRINKDPATGKISRTQPLSPFGPFKGVTDDDFDSNTINTFQLNGRAYVFGIKTDSNTACLFRINDNPATGLVRVSCPYWLTDYDYLAARSFEIDGHPYLFALRGCCHDITHLDPCGHWRAGQAYFKRVNDSGTGWDDLLQLEDLKIVRDATIKGQDGPPALLIGDFNIHPNKYGIMDQLFRKAGAVDAFIEAKGSTEGGNTIDYLDNKLFPIFYPGDKTISRIDYAYVKQSGSGLRVVPTDAVVFRSWTYGLDGMDLSDHYPLWTQFRVEPGCPVSIKGDFDCDQEIGLADLFVLCMAWMAEPGDSSWNRACDMNNPMDDRIDMKDFSILSGRWGNLPIHNITENLSYMDIQTAIAQAVNGDEIVVASGIYHEAIDFKGKAIYLHSADGPQATILDATGLSASVVTCKSGEQAGTILEGLTLTGGNGTTIDSKKVGGGMYNLNSSPTVRSCIFNANAVASGGGGMYNYASRPTVTDCTFSHNSANDSCGGIYNGFGSNPTFTRCTLSGNHGVVHGGGMVNVQNSNPTVTDCEFSGNTAGSLGGGMLNSVGCSPIVTHCTFIKNTAGDGGGMANNDNSNPIVAECTFSNNTTNTNNGGGMFNTVNSNPKITNSIFAGNTARKYGGGIYNNGSKPQFTNCLFIGNLTINGGGGIANYNSSNTTVTNCTFNNNTAGYGGGLRNWDSTVVVQNCILWANGPDQISYEGASTVTVLYSDIQGNWAGTGNIDFDPQFVDSAVGDLRLSSGSLCIDTGSNTAVPAGITTDLAGNPRIFDGDENGTATVDMGAYEYLLPAPAAGSAADLKTCGILAAYWLEDTEAKL